MIMMINICKICMLQGSYVYRLQYYYNNYKRVVLLTICYNTHLCTWKHYIARRATADISH